MKREELKTLLLETYGLEYGMTTALLNDIDAHVATQAEDLHIKLGVVEADRDQAMYNCAEAEAALERVRKLAEEWRYKGEFGWGPWQAGHGPDMESEILDGASIELRQAIDGGDPDVAE